MKLVMGCLGTAGVFEALTLFATHDKTVRAASPWQDDPYDVMVSIAEFTVPMLGLVIALRLLAWRAPGGPDRAAQTVRASAAMIALVGLTLAFEWAAVIGGVHRASWGAWTAVLVAGLVITSVLTAIMTVLVVRHRPARQWRHDWLDDVVLLCGRVPGLRRWATPVAAAWVRRRAMTVFVTLSVLAAVVIIGSLALGERWTNPLLIAWALVVETTSNLAFCLVSNGVAGFVARPPRSRSRRSAEASLLAGCVAIQLATAFRDALWPVTSVPALVALTLGAGLAVFLATAVLLAARPRSLTAPEPDP